MNWIETKKELPDINEMVLVYRSVHVGNYVKGIYIATFQHMYRNKPIFIIDDRETNQNNYRTPDEFSHWMKLPECPDNEEE